MRLIGAPIRADKKIPKQIQQFLLGKGARVEQHDRSVAAPNEIPPNFNQEI